ncbi:MAG: THUMP domain-containing protein [Desulfurococcaceae archaeon]
MLITIIKLSSLLTSWSSIEVITLYVYMVTVSGELPLRSSRTRPRFYRKLVENIRDALARSGIQVLNVEIENAKIVLSTDKDALNTLAQVFGVYRVGRVLSYEFRDLVDLAHWIAENARDMVAGRKFAVRVKRSGVHSFTSVDVAREAGSLLKPYSAGVDLENPDVVVEVEVRGSRAYLYRESTRGPRGLPTGVQGSALVLFSGGFDSPVAAWLTAKRGVYVDFLHFIMGSTQSSYYAYLVARELSWRWLHGYRPLFILVDFRDVVSEVVKKVDRTYRQVVLRALMYSAGLKIAENRGYSALVTGESIGQASSQTLVNIASIEAVVKPSKPILRPLLGYDKEEIVEFSRRIGLYDFSSKVAEMCAVAPTRATTRASPEEISEQLSRVDSSLIDRAVSSMRVVDVLSTSPEDAVLGDELEVDFIPENALVVDARSSRKESEKPIPGSILLSELDYSKLPRDRVIVLVCETGSISLLLARELREKGFKAYSLRGGIRGCKML